MNWIHTLTNHFTDELRVTRGKDKHSKADRGGSLQRRLLCFHKLDKADYTEENMGRRRRFCSLFSIFVALFCQGEKLCHSHRLLYSASC